MGAMKIIRCTNSRGYGPLWNMAATVELKRSGDEIHLSITMTLSPGTPMLDCEEQIRQALDAAGCLATQESLRQFDTDGSPLEMGQIRLTSKGLVANDYQSPYGEVRLARHVYQSRAGAKSFCPLD